MAQAAQPNRDTVTTIRQDGSRPFLYPSDVRGPFARGRLLSGWALILLFVALPWVQVGGYPAVFLDVEHLRFHLFGLTFIFQDLWLLFFLVTGVAFTLFYVTALFGRIWCGWTCPHSVFLDHVYRRIERIIDGDAPARRRLAKAPWTTSKALKRLSKHALYLLVSAAIAHIVLSYFVSLPALYGWVREGPGAHWSAFLFVAVATGLLYGNFAWFREQLCIVICPYGRLQSTLIDDHSLVVGYDEKRGEPRGKPSNPEAGDCIDCHRCVQVCPTGIDIRQGLQMECIGCSACIDACDEVMTKLKRPKGLIRYDSLTGLSGGRTKWIRPRTLFYTFMMLVGAAVMAYAFSTGLRPAAMTVVRMQGASFFTTEDHIRNQYQLRLVNKRDAAITLQVSALPAEAAAASFEQVGLREPVTLEPMVESTYTLVLRTQKEGWAGRFPVIVRVEGVDTEVTLQREVEFVGPDPRLMEPVEDFTP